MSRKTAGIVAIVAYAATVLLANYFIAHVGITFGPGPHLIEVWPGIYAPSGVLWVAAALALRNLVQEQLGKRWAVIGILTGAALSYVVSPSLALASAGAFAASETLDMLVWTTLRRRGVLVAQAVSNICSDVVDSVCFLWLAFGSLSLLAGQIIGKELVTLITILVLVALKVGRYAPIAVATDRGL